MCTALSWCEGMITFVDTSTKKTVARQVYVNVPNFGLNKPILE